MGIRFARVAVKRIETRRHRRLSVSACLMAALLSLPGAATAQQSLFFQGVSELADAAEGVYGDEGPRIGPALDAMSRALDTWNRETAREPSPAVQARRGL